MRPKQLSELEQEVMNIVWKLETCSVRVVLERMNTKKKAPAYTTVATILQRLYKKGLVIRKDKDFVILYAPKVSREEYGTSVTQSFFSKFFSAFGDAAIVSFADSIDQLPKKKKEYLLKLLSEHETK